MTNSVELILADLQPQILALAIAATTGMHEIQPLGRDHRHHVALCPDHFFLGTRQWVLLETVVMRLHRIGGGRAEWNNRDQLRVPLMNRQHDHRPSLDDLRLNKACEIAEYD